MNRIRVLVVDDSAFMRLLISDALNRHPALQVVGTAGSGPEAILKVEDLRPQVVTLDVQMPGMDGLTVLEHLVRVPGVPVVMVSSLTADGAEVTVRALELGAVDFALKPSPGSQVSLANWTDQLAEKVIMAAQARMPTPLPVHRALPRPAGGGGGARVVAIGTSTGGPAALHRLLGELPRGFPVPILIVQHMPPAFTGSLARRLDSLGTVRVKEAEQGDRVLPATALVAPGDWHLRLAADGEGVVVRLDQEPLVAGHRPSATALFRSAAEVFGRGTVGVVLTGMGNDGRDGVVAIKNAGGIVLAEDESSCVVFGMPKAAVGTGMVDRVLPLSGMARALAEIAG